MTELLLRRALPTDRDAIVELHYLALRTAGADAGPGPWDDDLMDVVQHYIAPGGEFLVLTEEQSLVGMGALRRVDATTGEVKRMRVRPDRQGRGYGRRVLTELESTALQLGLKRLILDTTERQEAAIGLYLSAGYQPFGTTIAAGLSSVVFEKSLIAE
jgi:GNAT superfamily N-acetyltransferase